jgi:hypothetical protein
MQVMGASMIPNGSAQETVEAAKNFSVIFYGNLTSFCIIWQKNK